MNDFLRCCKTRWAIVIAVSVFAIANVRVTADEKIEYHWEDRQVLEREYQEMTTSVVITFALDLLGKTLDD